MFEKFTKSMGRPRFNYPTISIYKSGSVIIGYLNATAVEEFSFCIGDRLFLYFDKETKEIGLAKTQDINGYSLYGDRIKNEVRICLTGLYKHYDLKFERKHYDLKHGKIENMIIFGPVDDLPLDKNAGKL